MTYSFKKILTLLIFFALSSLSFGQMIPPAEWSHKVTNKEVKIGEVIEVVFKTNVPSEYYIYSNDYGDCPPQKSEIVLDEHPSFKDMGIATPIGSKKAQDADFGCEVSKFYKKAELRKKIKILSANPEITGILYYQMCSESACVPHKYRFTIEGISIKSDEGGTTEPVVEPKNTEDPKEEKTPENTTDNGSTKVEFQGGDSAMLAYLMENCCNGKGGSNEAENLSEKSNFTPVPRDSVNYTSYKGNSADDKGTCIEKTFDGEAAEGGESYLGFFLVAFLGGLAALLTPCVFPMIPMTVSFFMKEGNTKAQARRTGIVYALSIIAIYVLIGTVLAVAVGPSFANWLSTHWIPNTFFFLIFVIFAASFFGAFEIVLPSKLVNKMDQNSSKGGFVGIFFMAFTIVLVSFSCTGPIVGSILVESAGGQFLKPLIGMLGFSLAFAIPFGLFAIFPNWLNGLPQSGGWLNSVKVVLGFIELALGLKFLSIADQTYHWGILDREIYLALWIIIFTLMGFYLLGKIKFAHDSDLPFIKVPRLFMVIATFTFVLYLTPGMWGAPLNALAGYLPPMHTHDFDLIGTIKNPNGVTMGNCGKPKYGEKLHLPHGLKGYFDYEEGMECARSLAKPVFIDFTGHGCVNCREMEARVWSDPRILKVLNEEYVVISLYVDDKKIMLPEEEQYYSRYDGYKMKTLADKNSDIEKCYFNSNQQPLYVLLDNYSDMIGPKRAHNTNKEAFLQFLNNGVEEYKKRMSARSSSN